MYHRSRVTTAPAAPLLTPAHRSEAPESAVTRSLLHSNPLSRVAAGAARPQAQAQALSRVSAGQLARTGPALLQLQRQYGNRAVGQLLAQSVVHRPPTLIQAKLTVNAPGDKYEMEADRVADAVMRMPAVQQMESDNGGEEPEVTTKRDPARVAGGAFEADEEFEQQLKARRGQGQPLPPDLRAEFEAKLGADFSGVRVHTDPQADQLNQSIQSDAFTTGHDVFFRQGAYDLRRKDGRALIAHELTHVVQQEADVKTGVGLVQRGRFEKEVKKKVKTVKEKIEKLPEKAQKAVTEAIEEAPEKAGKVAKTTVKLAGRALREVPEVAKRKARSAGRIAENLAVNLENIPTEIHPPQMPFSELPPGMSLKTFELSQYEHLMANYQTFAEDLKKQGQSIPAVWDKEEVTLLYNDTLDLMNKYANDRGAERESVKQMEGIDNDAEAKRIVDERASELANIARDIKNALDTYY